MAKYTSEDYEKARQLEREGMFDCLQAAYDTLTKMTNYNGQPDYEGDEVDFNAFVIAQGVSQATEMLMNIIDFVDQLKFEFGEEEE